MNRNRSRSRGGGAARSFIGSPFWTNLKTTNTTHLKAAINRVLANTGNGYIAFAGDSTTEGQGSIGTSQSNRAAAFPELVASQLNTLDPTYQTLADSFWGLGGETTLPNYVLYNPHLTIGADWISSTGSDGLSFGGRFLQQSAGTTYLQFTPTAAFDRAEITVRCSSAHTLTVEDDAAAVVATFNTGNVNVLQKFVVTMGKSCAFLKIRQALGNPSVIGIATYVNAQKRLMCWNMGWRASFTSQWSQSSQNFNSINGWDDILPDAVFLDLCINDPNNLTPLGQYQTELTAIATAIKAAGVDCILSTGVPSDTATRPAVAVQNQYRSIVYQVANSLDLPLIDDRSQFVSFTVANGLGWMFDDIHPNNVGYPKRANTRRDFIAAVRALP